jgi:hypothetical protein
MSKISKTVAFGLLVGIILCGCQHERTVSEPPTATEYSTIVIDSCEYLQYYADLKFALAYTQHDYKAQFLTHKGNCEFCLSRNNH